MTIIFIASIQRDARPNVSLPGDTFTIPTPLAAKLLALLDCDRGQYWESFAKAVRRAMKAKQPMVVTTTAGFSTDELRGAISEAGGKSEFVM